MKNKLPQPFKEDLPLTAVGESINQIIAYLQEKEDIAKKNRLEAFRKAGAESAKRVKEKEENEIRELIPTWDELHKAGKSEIIRVPDNIVFTKYNNRYYLGNGHKWLLFDKEHMDWEVINDIMIDEYKIPMQLIKCNYDDIEVGSFFYDSANDLDDIHQLLHYSLKLDDSQVLWSDKGIMVSDLERTNDYYLVTPIQ